MRRPWAIVWVAAMLAGCSRDEKRAEPREAGPPPQAATSTAPDPARQDGRPVIVAFGDSLTAGHGADPGQSYPDFLQQELDRKGYRYRIVNQGISGDTTSGGLARLDAAVSLKPKVVIVELGANDGLRGLPVETTRANLREIVGAFQRAGAQVLLCGMTLPRNYGPDYIRSFEEVFRGISRETGAALLPFLLDGVATRRDMMQPDGLHPRAAGNVKVAQNVMARLEPLLK